MKPLSVVVAQSNSKTAEMLEKSLYNHFRVVHLAGDVDALRLAIPRYRADVAIVDLELAALSEVQQLKQEFAATTIVCTHRLADEKMWANALGSRRSRLLLRFRCAGHCPGGQRYQASGSLARRLKNICLYPPPSKGSIDKMFLFYSPSSPNRA